MDPGNWATDLEGGARFGYALIWVLLMSNLMAVLLQTLGGTAGGGHGPRPGAGLSRRVLARAQRRALGAGRGRDRRDRPGRDPGNDHRPQAALRPAALVGLLDHGLRHLRAPLSAAVGHAADGGRHPGAGGDHRRLLPGPDLPGQAGPGGDRLRACGPACRRGRCSSRSASWARRSCRTTCTCTRPWCRPGGSAAMREQVDGVPLLLDRRGDRAQRGVLRQRRDPDLERRGLSPPRHRGRHASRRRTSCFPRSWVKARRSCSPSRFCAPARARP